MPCCTLNVNLPPLVSNLTEIVFFFFFFDLYGMINYFSFREFKWQRWKLNANLGYDLLI